MDLSRQAHVLIATLIGLCLVTLTVWVYAPGQHNSYVYEDSVVRESSGSAYRPVAAWTYALDRRLGDTPAIAHAQSLAWHLLNGLLVWLLASRLLRPAGALLVVAAFLLHPLMTEAVAYAAARADLLATTGMLAACLVAVVQPWWMSYGIGAGLLWALGAKESAVAGPLLVGLCCYGRTSRGLRGAGAYTGLLVVLTVVAVVFRVLLWQFDTEGHAPGSWLSYAAHQGTALVTYTAMLIAPVGQSIDHDFDTVSTARLVLSSVGLLTTAILAGWRFSRHHDTWALGMLWLVVAVAPRFLLRLPEWLNEHQFYLPAVGGLLCLGSLFDTTLAALGSSERRRGASANFHATRVAQGA